MVLNICMCVYISLCSCVVIVRYHFLKFTWRRSEICWMVSIDLNWTGLNSQAFSPIVTKVNLPVHEDKNKIPYVKVFVQFMSVSVCICLCKCASVYAVCMCAR